MMRAAVMGACRHIALTRITYEESRTVADIASGSIHAVDPPTSRKRNPVTQPKSELRMRPRKLTTASFTWGSIEETIAPMAQIGLVLAPNRSRSQRRVVPTKMFTAR